MVKKIRRKVFVNKNNKQLTVTLSKKQIKAVDPTIKFNEELFVDISFNHKRRKKNG